MKSPVLILAIVLIALGTYQSATKYYFVHDDFQLLYKASTQSAGDVFTSFTRTRDLFYRPLSTTAYFWIFYNAVGLKPTYYHVFNVLLHAANSVLVFLLVLLITKKKHAAVLCSLFYSISPIQFQSVFWISNIQTLLYVHFFLLTYIAYVKRWSGASVVLSIFALCSKEAAITIPAYLFAYSLYNSFSRYDEGNRLKKILVSARAIIPHCLVSAIYLLLRFWNNTALHPQHYALDLLDYKTITKNCIIYFKWMVLSLSNNSIAVISLSIAVLLIGSILFLYTKRQHIIRAEGNLRSTFIFGLAWFVLGLFPVVCLVNHSPEPYYLTVSSIGFFLILFSVLGLGMDIERYRALFRSATLVIVILYIASSVTQINTMEKVSYITTASEKSEDVLSQIQILYPEMPSESSVVIFNTGNIWHVTKKHYALRLIYGDSSISTYDGDHFSLVDGAYVVDDYSDELTPNRKVTLDKDKTLFFDFRNGRLTELNHSEIR